MTTEIITITKISGRTVTYSGSEYFDGCDVSEFPHKPVVGEQFKLISDFIHPSRIEEI